MREVENEFNTLWSSLTSPLTSLAPRSSYYQVRT